MGYSYQQMMQQSNLPQRGDKPTEEQQILADAPITLKKGQSPRVIIVNNIGYIIVGLVLVAGYFAYKKFKK